MTTGTTLTVVSALLASLSEWAWLADLASHFRLHYALGILFLLGLAWTRRAWLATALLLISLAIHLTPVIYQERQSKSVLPPASAQTHTLLVTNVLKHNNQLDAVVTRLRELDADSVAVIELTPTMQQHLIKSGLYRHFHGLAEENATGVGIFSRHPFEQATLPDFGVPAAPTALVTQRLAGTTLRLAAVHPLAPITPARYHARNEQFQQIADYASAQKDATIIAGDFNSSPWSTHFAKLIQDSALKANSHHWGLRGTWPACTPLLSIPIDHVLTSTQINITQLRSIGIPGSDHCGLWLEFEFAKP